MEPNDASLNALREAINRTLTHDNSVRKQAEAYLQGVEATPGFPRCLLALVERHSTSTSGAEDRALRQAASVMFKNMVKRRWQPAGEYEDLEPITAADREPIKGALVDLLGRTPPDVQAQLAEAVTIVAAHDFPSKWQWLLPQLSQSLLREDMLVTHGVMLTANSIMKRFRYVEKSDHLYADLLHCLESFSAPLQTVFTKHWARVEALTTAGGGRATVDGLLSTLRLIARVFYSLNWQDLPEQFEDNMPAWMTVFAAVLRYRYLDRTATDDDDDQEAAPLEQLQVAVLENINLYVEKYEEEFLPHLPTFTTAVWALLLDVGPQARLDGLATQGIQFLSTLAGKKTHGALFTQQVLADIVQHIVVRNLTCTTADEELFQDNPTDYIRKDMEGSDQHTRRRSAMELVRALLKQFAPQVSALCEAHMGSLLEQYAAGGGRNWRLKDAALHLLLASAARNATCTELNPLVQVQSAFTAHVLPEVQMTNGDVSVRPVLKADALKLLCLFRTHLPGPFLVSLLPAVMAHLRSRSVVVQTYAALTLERWLSIKDASPSGVQVPRVPAEHLHAHLDTLFTTLFAVLENVELPENDHVMKAIMRILALLGPAAAPLAPVLVTKLAAIFERVARNPVNATYNHYMFECLGLLVRASCRGAEPAAADRACDLLESLLFPPFQRVLSEDISEFTPYVFQLLAQLLAYRPGSGLSVPYRALFAPLLSPVLWERRGNVPALAELLHSYIVRDISYILSAGALPGVLGVFQKLLSSRANEAYAFRVLDSLLIACPTAAMSPFSPTAMQLLLQRLQDAVRDDRAAQQPGEPARSAECRNPRYVRRVLHTVAAYATAHGGVAATALLDSAQGAGSGLSVQVATGVWGRLRALLLIGPAAESRRIVAGLTRMLCESVLRDAPAAFVALLSLAVDIARTLGGTARPDDEDTTAANDDSPEAREFDSSYSKLVYAGGPPDAESDIVTGAKGYLPAQLATLCTGSAKGPCLTAVQALPQELQQALQQLCQEARVTLQ